MALADTQRPFAFGDWQVDPSRSLLTGGDGESVRLEPRLMDLLLLFAGSGGRVLGKDEIAAATWGDRAVLLAGPLADRVFEPARRLPLWRPVAWLVGAGQGAGIALMFVIAGTLTMFLILAVYSVPAIRRMERALPDHDATAEPA